MEENHSLRPKKSSLVGGEEIIELLWQNGQLVMQSHSQRSHSSLKKLAEPPPIHTDEESAATQLYMPEDDMASWINYHLDSPSFDRDICADFLFPAPSPPRSPDRLQNPVPPPPTAPRPPVPPGSRAELHSFGLSDSRERTKERTVVDSSETPSRGHESRVSTMAEGSGAKGGRRDTVTAEVTVTSSPGGCVSGASSSGQRTQNPLAEPATATWKRKASADGGEEDEECHSEGVEFETFDAKTKICGSTSAKRSCAAEVHKRSERRRRDRINEKMRALQELIPHCNKSDKASMLDEAIEYLKWLQMQVQMMSMGCSMFPMMFPNVQYMSPVGMGMGMSRPAMPFPSVLTRSNFPVPAAIAHLGPKFPIQGFHLQQVPTPDPSSIPASHQTGPMVNSISAQNLTQHQTPNFVDPYQHFLALHQLQLPVTQSQPIAQPSTSNSSSSRAENHVTPETG